MFLVKSYSRVDGRVDPRADAHPVRILAEVGPLSLAGECGAGILLPDARIIRRRLGPNIRQHRRPVQWNSGPKPCSVVCKMQHVVVGWLTRVSRLYICVYLALRSLFHIM